MKVSPERGRATEDDPIGGDGTAPVGNALAGLLSSVVLLAPCGFVLSDGERDLRDRHDLELVDELVDGPVDGPPGGEAGVC